MVVYFERKFRPWAMQNSSSKKFTFATLKTVGLSVAIGLMFYYLMGFSFTPEQFDFSEVSFLELLNFLLIDQFAVEALYIFLMLKSMEYYCLWMNISLNKISNQIFKLIPFFGLVFFPLNPITQSIRYIVRNGFSINWNVFLSQYLFSPSLYVVYTVFGSVIGLIVLILKIYSKDHQENSKEPLKRLVGEHEAVMKPIDVEEIFWIEVSDRKYWVYTADKVLRITKTISELEEQLDSNQFFRINRSVIVNSKYIDSYSPWESGTYLVEIKKPRKKEFSISRNRVKEFKKVMKI
jgi:hypothetical protein